MKVVTLKLGPLRSLAKGIWVVAGPWKMSGRIWITIREEEEGLSQRTWRWVRPEPLSLAVPIGSDPGRVHFYSKLLSHRPCCVSPTGTAQAPSNFPRSICQAIAIISSAVCVCSSNCLFPKEDLIISPPQWLHLILKQCKMFSPTTLLRFSLLCFPSPVIVLLIERTIW